MKQSYLSYLVNHILDTEVFLNSPRALKVQIITNYYHLCFPQMLCFKIIIFHKYFFHMIVFFLLKISNFWLNVMVSLSHKMFQKTYLVPAIGAA